MGRTHGVDDAPNFRRVTDRAVASGVARNGARAVKRGRRRPLGVTGDGSAPDKYSDDGESNKTHVMVTLGRRSQPEHFARPDTTP